MMGEITTGKTGDVLNVSNDETKWERRDEALRKAKEGNCPNCGCRESQGQAKVFVCGSTGGFQSEMCRRLAEAQAQARLFEEMKGFLRRPIVVKGLNLGPGYEEVSAAFSKVFELQLNQYAKQALKIGERNDQAQAR